MYIHTTVAELFCLKRHFLNTYLLINLLFIVFVKFYTCICATLSTDFLFVQMGSILARFREKMF
jgi:hypothetical protein